MNDDYFPLSIAVGFCILPGTEPEELARVLLDYLDQDPDCARLAHFSMCLLQAWRDAYSENCDQ